MHAFGLKNVRIVLPSQTRTGRASRSPDEPMNPILE